MEESKFTMRLFATFSRFCLYPVSDYLDAAMRDCGRGQPTFETIDPEMPFTLLGHIGSWEHSGTAVLRR